MPTRQNSLFIILDDLYEEESVSKHSNANFSVAETRHLRHV